MVRKTFRTNREALEFANSNDIKVYRVKNVKTRDFPLFGVWVMEWEYQGNEMGIPQWKI